MGTLNATLLSAVPNTNQVDATFSWASWAKLRGHRRNDLEVVNLASQHLCQCPPLLAERSEFPASRGVLFLAYPEKGGA